MSSKALETEALETLPRGWESITLESISEIILGQSPPSSTYNKEQKGLPFYQGKLDFGEIYPSPTTWCKQPKKVVEKGDVLISVRAPVGPTNICPEKSAIGRGLAAIRPLGGIESFFILYLMRSLENKWRGTGTTFDAIGGDLLRNLRVPLPPLAEQQRIVKRIDELFTRLQAGIEMLMKGRPQVRRYRHSVLKYAFEGKLTEKWREYNKQKLEPATQILERIRDLRQAKCRAGFSATSQDMPILPEGWLWTTVNEIVESFRNGIYKPARFYTSDGMACLRMYNIENGLIVWKDIRRMKLTNKEISEYEIKEGDILVNRVNSRELVGKSAVIPPNLERSVYEAMNIRVRVFKPYIDSKYVNYWFLLFSRQYFSLIAPQTVGMASINQDQLGRMPIPLASTMEQMSIVAEVERRFSIAENTNAMINTIIQHVHRLRHCILKAAFEGNLVSPDPTDEPARVLLQRIQAEKSEPVGNRANTRPLDAVTHRGLR